MSAQWQELLEWKSPKDEPPKPGMIIKKWKNGSVWAGMFSGADKEMSFDQYIQVSILK